MLYKYLLRNNLFFNIMINILLFYRIINFGIYLANGLVTNSNMLVTNSYKSKGI